MATVNNSQNTPAQQPAKDAPVTADATKVPSPAAQRPEEMDRFALAVRAREAARAKEAAERTGTAKREREPDLGGLVLKLSVVGTIPGHQMYWANDEKGEIEELIYQGFDFVEPGEVRRAANLVGDSDLSNRISRYVGTRDDGSPLRAYLLKCPDELWNERQAAKQYQASAWDEQIRNGRMKPTDKTQYIPKGVSNHLETRMGEV
jgi:hypothetical protein